MSFLQAPSAVRSSNARLQVHCQMVEIGKAVMREGVKQEVRTGIRLLLEPPELGGNLLGAESCPETSAPEVPIRWWKLPRSAKYRLTRG